MRTQFEIMAKKKIMCDICGSPMLSMPGGGWDNDRMICTDRECQAEIVFPTSTDVEDEMDKDISVDQFNYAVEMITATPSEKAICAYQNDPFVNRMVHSIKAAIRSNGVANHVFNRTSRLKRRYALIAKKGDYGYHNTDMYKRRQLQHLPNHYTKRR